MSAAAEAAAGGAGEGVRVGEAPAVDDTAGPAAAPAIAAPSTPAEPGSAAGADQGGEAAPPAPEAAAAAAAPEPVAEGDTAAAAPQEPPQPPLPDSTPGSSAAPAAEPETEPEPEPEAAKAEAGAKEEAPPAANGAAFVVNVPSGQKDMAIRVHVFRAEGTKPFLGGFRSKKTGAEYHNASSQTPHKFKLSDKELNSRETQTVELSTGLTNNQQTAREAGTQMDKPGHFVSAGEDRVFQPTGSYETADERAARILGHVVVIQKYFRRWKATRYVDGLRQQKRDFDAWTREELQRKEIAAEDEFQDQLHRRLHPKRPADFDLLYTAVEEWKQEQMLELSAAHPEGSPERQKALVALLDQECRHLASIEQLRKIARDERRDRQQLAFLKQAAKPKQWQSAVYGKQNEMDTETTQRARQLQQLYTDLRRWDASIDERLDTLIEAKAVVQKHDSKLCREIISLLNREADLLLRSTNPRNLEGLRRRSLNLFLQFTRNPEYNPEAGRILSEHQAPEAHKKNIFKCISCGQFLAASCFEVSPIIAGTGKCRKCTKVENYARRREDNAPLQRMMDQIRQSEVSLDDGSQACFLMTLADLRYLVCTIWGAKSALSANSVMFNLRLGRWDATEPLTPWNCVLLTEDEMGAHHKVPDPTAVYGDTFLRGVRKKHLLARNHFTSLIAHLKKAHRAAR